MESKSLEKLTPLNRIQSVRQDRTKKVWNGSTIIPGEYLYVDISLINGESFGDGKLCALIVDDYIEYC
jgi:hypothetical protein